jgi:two-component system phosphate regulon sensor histidine kinase PhoR
VATASFRPFPWRVFLKTVALQFTLLFVAILISGLLARTWFKERIEKQLSNQLEAALEIASHGFESVSKSDWCRVSAAGTNYRVTLITLEGVVVCDSHHNGATLENHLGRSEISDALGVGHGFSIRHSDTDNTSTMYYARAHPSADFVLRLSLSMGELTTFLDEFDRTFVFVLLIITVLLAFGQVWVGRVFVMPLRAILTQAESALRNQESVLTAPQLSRSTWGEWENLESLIETLRRDIKDKMNALNNEKKEQSVIMDAISDALVVVQKDESVVYANRIFCELFTGHTPYTGKHLVQFTRDPAVQNTFAHVLQSGVRSETVVVTFAGSQSPSQGQRYFSLVVAPLTNEKGTPYAAVGVFHDVTDLKLAEQMRIDFVANVSHEIRTPLSSIKGFADTILGDAEQGLPIDAELVKPIARNSDRMVRLVSDLLDLSALDTGATLEKSSFDAMALTQKIVDSFLNAAKLKNQTLVLKPADMTLYADISRVEQVLVNLIENACKYTPNEGQIEVAWSCENNSIALRVSDNGPGIESQHLPRLFERFYRVDKGRSRNLGGTGLGLAIVKHIMLAHGGRVEVESQLGKGTTFRCLFPIK